MRIFSLPKILPVVKLRTKDALIILGSPLGPKSPANLLEKKEQENVNGIADKLRELGT